MSPAWKGRLSVLLIDSATAVVVQDYKFKFERLFQKVGYSEPMIETQVSGGDLELLFKTNYYDVIVCDVSLGKDQQGGDALGLQALRYLRGHYPGLYLIAYSRFPLEEFNREPEVCEFDLFITKARMEIRSYSDHLVRLLRQNLRINASAFVSSEGQLWTNITPLELLDLNRIVRKLTFTGVRDGGAETVGRVRFRRLDGGYSGALVLQMHAYTRTEFVCVQALLKVACRGETELMASLERELTSYNTYVKWYLPYRWRPELLGDVLEGSLRCICYAFVTASDEPFHSLSELAVHEDHGATRGAIDSIFRPSFQRWYHKHNVTRQASLGSFYFERCFGERGLTYAQAAAFERELRQFDQDGRRFVINAEPCLYPQYELLVNPAGNYLECIVHGDLNTRNIFVSKHDNSIDVTLIDFSETGRGHVFYDFIVFEVNLRLDVRSRGRLSLVVRVAEERALNRASFDGSEQDTPTDSFDAVSGLAANILHLRRYARQNFSEERFESYFYGLAVYAFSLLNAANLGQEQKTILASCTVAALLDLAKVGYWQRTSAEREGT